MGAVSTPIRIADAQATRVHPKEGDGMRYARGALLDELPGAAFGIVTLGYVVMSLISLAW